MQNELGSEELDADYENGAVETALQTLKDAPDYDNLAALLNSLREGLLFVDITGGSTKKKGTRMRTTRTTTGQKVLPIFTSMNALREAHMIGGRKRSATEAKGAMMPALDALKLIESDRFVACELNPGKNSLVILRKFIALVLKEETITTEMLES